MSDEFEDVQAAVGDALAEALRQSSEMVTRWVAVIEVVDEDGVRAAYAIAPPEAKPWDTLGLLTFGVQQEQAAAITDED